VKRERHEDYSGCVVDTFHDYEGEEFFSIKDETGEMVTCHVHYAWELIKDLAVHCGFWKRLRIDIASEEG
jgi:hypothetical protein